LGFVLGGPFVLPAPVDTFALVFDFIRKGALWQPAFVTALDVLIGYGIGCLAGLVLGLAGGAVEDLGTALQPVSLIILGIPPIAWIVMALLWLGPQGIVPSFTVAVGTAPIVFAGAIAGMRSSNPDLDELAAAFSAGWQQKLIEIRLPQVAVALTPALATSLGLAWKMALMAEVLGGSAGIGGRIADARTHLDTTETMAWIIVALALLLVTDRLLARAVGAIPGLSR
jgi:NitT/TauT family transport system permease protein